MKEFDLFADSDCGIAENPLWNQSEQMLYWKGFKPDQSNMIFRKSMNTASDRFEAFQLPVGLIGGFAFAGDGGLLIFAQAGKIWHWQPGNPPVMVAKLPEADDKTYFNDLIADPEGRIYCGVLAHDYFNPKGKGQYGSLWRFDPDGSFHRLESAVGGCPNGMGFSPDRKYFYFAVTDEQTVYRYDYSRDTGRLDNRRVFIKAPGCDGLTVDAEGCMWLAHWGGQLTRYSPEGETLAVYSFPPEIRAISSVIFGGPDYRTIFITTANYPIDSKAGNFLGGGVLALTQTVTGVPEFPAAGPGTPPRPR